MGFVKARIVQVILITVVWEIQAILFINKFPLA